MAVTAVVSLLMSKQSDDEGSSCLGGEGTGPCYSVVCIIRDKEAMSPLCLRLHVEKLDSDIERALECFSVGGGGPSVQCNVFGLRFFKPYIL